MKITINTQEISVSTGTTILAAAQLAGINIPTLCHIKGKSAESCGLCLVEIVGQSEPVRSCSTKVSKGMAIITDSKSVHDLRKKQLARLAETHFGDCKAPCNLTCPGQINVQGYIAHVAKGQYEEALRLVMERNPFPFSVGRVCPRFCETRCRRILVDEPVSINHLKRFVADWCMTNKVKLNIEREPATNKKVAIIGGGPAGLTSAYYLAQKGHAVTVFEAQPKLGGMLRYGIPEYKIPRNVLDYEINTIMRLGVSVRLSQRWGTDFNLQALQDEGFDATLITVGATVDQPLEIPGGTINKVIPAVKLLYDIAEGNKRELGRRAAIIGGNNIAMETARAMIRKGVVEVTVIYPRAKTEMPANQRNIKEAEREGVQFLLMASPVQILEAKDCLKLELIRMKLGEPDDKGIRHPEAIPGATNILQVDTVVTSIGQMTFLDKIEGGDLEEQLELTPKNNIKANPRSSLTNLSGVFAAGDAVSGPRSVIQAVVSARRAAENIHLHLMGESKDTGESRFNFHRGKTFDDVDLRNFEGISVKLREKMPERPPEISKQNFDEIKLGFSETMAKREAARCLACGCTAFNRCDLKEQCISHDVDPIKTGMGTKPTYTLDTNHPIIVVDLNKCIFCKRCENSCEYKALEITAAEFDKQGRPIGITLQFNEKCVHCGKCVDNCATGALNKKDLIVPIVNELVRNVRTTCPYCGAGCQMILKVKGNTIMEVTADPDQSPNYGALCVKGRFGFNFVQHPDRLKTPLIRRNGVLVEATWDEALEVVAKKFFDLKAMYGADSIAAFSCARCTNEENFLMQKFMRAVIGTNNIDHCARL